MNWDNDSKFIAAARTDIPDLLEYVKYLEMLLKNFKEVMEKVIGNLEFYPDIIEEELNSSIESIDKILNKEKTK